MSLPEFSTQAELFSTAGLSASMFAPTDRYRLFAKLVYPPLAATRATLEKCYCLENGREALEPVLMLGASILQYLDGVPDRQAVEMLHYHAGWNFALNRQLGDPVFHPTSLVNFRDRLRENKQSALGFTTILEALEAAGLVARQSRQRLDSTQMFGRVAKMSRLDCVRESLRLALKELEEGVPAEARPGFWVGLWERYVESQVDYRVSAEALGRKLAEAGTDAWQLLEWLGQAKASPAATGAQVELLRRGFCRAIRPAPRAGDASHQGDNPRAGQGRAGRCRGSGGDGRHDHRPTRGQLRTLCEQQPDGPAQPAGGAPGDRGGRTGAGAGSGKWRVGPETLGKWPAQRPLPREPASGQRRGGPVRRQKATGLGWGAESPRAGRYPCRYGARRPNEGAGGAGPQ